MSKKTYYSAAMLGTFVDGDTARLFREKCSPYLAEDVLDALIVAVAKGFIKIGDVIVTEEDTNASET